MGDSVESVSRVAGGGCLWSGLAYSVVWMSQKMAVEFAGEDSVAAKGRREAQREETSRRPTTCCDAKQLEKMKGK